MQIFQFLGSLCGYALWACFLLVKNFGVAIILFTILFRILSIPLTIKQQKSMAVNQRISAKQQAIREKYANNRVKMNEEIQKLYQKEHASPMGGCLVSFLPLLLMMGIFYSVAYPLSNTLHINSGAVSQASQYVSTIPGFSASSGFYSQIEFIKIFPNIQDTNAIKDLFSQAELGRISDFSQSFNFLGLDLLQSPNANGASPLLLIPIICLVSSIGSQILLTKLQGTQTKGCMAIVLYGLPLFTAYIAYTVPAAVGLYWIFSTIFNTLSSLLMQRWYSAQILGARAEAQRIALLEVREANAEKIG